MSYVIRHGRRIEVETVLTKSPPPHPRKEPYHATWVKLPRHWISALGQSRSPATYRLALLLLLEEFRHRQRRWKRARGWIVLSASVVGGMDRATKARAARELATLGLIRIGPSTGRQAMRVSILLLR
jgi:hypothetical protein